MMEHWRTEDDADGVRWLLLDKTGDGPNVLSHDVLRELGELVDQIVADAPKGVVIKSGKASGFIAGADISEFDRLESEAEAESRIAGVHALLERIETLPCPTVAAISGFALGGGLELAMACDYRVAVEGYERCIGLPEVQLGIHPGFGGTVRSVRLLGAPLALDLMLTGRSLSPIEAHRAGLIDRLSESARLEAAARELLRRRPPRRRAPLHLRLLNLRPIRGWLAGRIRARVARRASREHYPAPFAIIRLWVEHGGSGADAYRAEARSIARLVFTPTSRNLVRVFFLRERLRGLAQKSHTATRVHVVGAGVMGGDIAAWCALRGLNVTIQDRAMEFVEPALGRAAELFERRLKAPGAAVEARERIVVDLDGERVGEADVVIEAIVERLDAKQGLYRDLEPRMRPDALLATNTSSIRLERLAEGLARPGSFVGLHFFNPVARLPLVEVIRGAATEDSSLCRAVDFVAQIDKLPLPCRSAPGFVVNRVLVPYMLEALLAHQEGVALETIDRAAEEFGMPMGPVELADRVGLDVALHVTEILGETLDVGIPAQLKDKVEAGDLGAKTGRGFYAFEKGRPVKSKEVPAPDADLQDRLILALVNEAMACYEDEVVEDLDLLDAGIIFGTGFAPFTGGPIQYARARGVTEVVERLHALASICGPRFEPRPGWQQLISGA